MLEDTLVIWGGEFGRTPMVQGGNDGRDHHPNAFTMWLAGGGIKPGIVYGETERISRIVRQFLDFARPPVPFEVPYAEAFYFLVLLIAATVVLVNRWLEDSHIGRAWEAIREDELAAQAMGVPLVRTKLLAFACGASFAGIMGVVFAAKQVFISPESFTFLESIGVLAMVILGGMGSIPGAIVGATVVTVLNLQVLKGFSLWLNELKNAGVVVLGYNLADLPTQLEPAKYERMIFGAILVLMMIFRPQGIFPVRRRARELGER